MNSGIRWKLDLLGLLGLSLCVGGCVVAIGSSRDNSSPPPPAVFVPGSAEAADIAEIDAAAQLGMDSSRCQAMAQIADRPSLSPAAQVHLINSAYRCLGFESSKVLVLQKVIARPDFSAASRHAVVSQLRQLGFEASRQDLLHRISQRVAEAPPH